MVNSLRWYGYSFRMKHGHVMRWSLEIDVEDKMKNGQKDTEETSGGRMHAGCGLEQYNVHCRSVDFCY